MEPCAVDRNQIPIHPRDEGRDRDTNNHLDGGFEMTTPTALDGKPLEGRADGVTQGPNASDSTDNAVDRTVHSILNP